MKDKEFGRGWAESRSRFGTFVLIGEEMDISYALYHICFTLTFYMASTPPFISVFMSKCPRGEDSWNHPPPPNTHTRSALLFRTLSLATHTRAQPLYTSVLESPRGLNLGCLLPITGVIIKLPLTHKTHLCLLPR